MTLNELRYVIALARERNFRRAAERVFVSQPALSLAIAKLEDELGVALFERARTEVKPTATGEQIVEQAARVMAEVARLRDIATAGRDDLLGTLRLGVIYTAGPYLIPALIPALHRLAPAMPLHLEENLTVELLARLHDGRLDAAVMALPVEAAGLRTRLLYEEDFVVVVPRGHSLARRRQLDAGLLRDERLLLLDQGHCFANQVTAACPGTAENAEILEGHSLETIRNMVASGLGVTVMPASAMSTNPVKSLLALVPFKPPVPARQMALVWRESYLRHGALLALARAIRESGLAGVRFPAPDAI